MTKPKLPDPTPLPPDTVVRRFFEFKPITDAKSVLHHIHWVTSIKAQNLPPLSCPPSEATPTFLPVNDDTIHMLGPAMAHLNVTVEWLREMQIAEDIASYILYADETDEFPHRSQSEDR